MSGRAAVETLIIGAGPSGLAVAACLERRGLPYAMVERSDRVGSTWHTHYRRLHLHTAKQYSHLPHLEMPATYPRYPSRQQVVDYLEAYADHHGIAPRLSATVTAARYAGDAWEIDVDPAPGYRARRLVVATGYNGVPFEPAFEGLADFPGEVVHSARYGDGARFAGQEVLVVGIGNSGAEIAVDLWEHGARPSITVRSPIHVVPRDILGMPSQRTTILMSRLPARLADRLTLPLVRRLVGDLSPWGIERPDIGPLEQIERDGRVPLIDVGTVDLIKQGGIRVVPGVDRLEGDLVTFSDGARRRFDALVLATGYRAALDRFLEDHATLTDARGYPTAHGREAAVPGLYFCGFRNPTTGALRESRLEAERIAKHIASAHA